MNYSDYTYGRMFFENVFENWNNELKNSENNKKSFSIFISVQNIYDILFFVKL